MPVQVIGPSSDVAAVSTTFKALHTTPRPPEAAGYYRASVQTGLITTIAAGATIFSFRWADATRLAVIQYLGIKWQTVAGFTAAQEIGVEGVIARSFTASDSGGTAKTPATNDYKKRTSYPTSAVTDMRVSTTSALTVGTRTADGNPMLQGQYAELATAATVAKGKLDLFWDMTNGTDSLQVLAQNEGLLVRNQILMGAGGTARVSIELAWFETLIANWPG